MKLTARLSSWLIIGVLVAITISGLLPLAHPDLFYIHDYLHAARVGELSRALVEGHIPPRWSANFGYGLGMPLFEFYAPLSYVVGALFYLAHVPIDWVVRIMFIIVSAVSAWGAYLLGRSLYGRLGGLLVSASFVLAPYRAVNLFIRGAVSEAYGMMVMPWILYGAILTIQGKVKGRVLLAISVAALFLSHNLTSLIFLPFAVLFSITYSLIYHLILQKKRRAVWANLWSVLFSFGLGFGLSAFYVVPALVEKSFTKVEQLIVGGYFDYSLHFLYIRQFFNPTWSYGGSEWGPNDGLSFFFGWGQWIGLVISGLFFVKVVVLFLRHKNAKDSSARRHRAQISLYAITGCLLVLTLYLTLGHSKFIWDMLPLLSFIQFPWRFMSAFVLFLALVIGAIPQFLRHRPARIYLSGGLVLVMCAFAPSYFRPERYLETASSLYYTDPQKIRTILSPVLPDYMPIQVPDEIALELEQIDTRGAVLMCQSVSNCNAQWNSVDVLVDRAHQKLLRTNNDDKQEMIFNTAYFPGWIAEIDGSRTELEVTEQGLISIIVPEGEHVVGISFENTVVRSVADGVSAISLVLLLWIGISFKKTATITKRSTT